MLSNPSAPIYQFQGHAYPMANFAPPQTTMLANQQQQHSHVQANQKQFEQFENSTKKFISSLTQATDQYLTQMKPKQQPALQSTLQQQMMYGQPMAYGAMVPQPMMFVPMAAPSMSMSQQAMTNGAMTSSAKVSTPVVRPAPKPAASVAPPAPVFRDLAPNRVRIRITNPEGMEEFIAALTGKKIPVNSLSAGKTRLRPIETTLQVVRGQKNLPDSFINVAEMLGHGEDNIVDYELSRRKNALGGKKEFNHNDAVLRIKNAVIANAGHNKSASIGITKGGFTKTSGELDKFNRETAERAVRDFQSKIDTKGKLYEFRLIPPRQKHKAGSEQRIYHAYMAGAEHAARAYHFMLKNAKR